MTETRVKYFLLIHLRKFSELKFEVTLAEVLLLAVIAVMVASLCKVTYFDTHQYISSTGDSYL